MYTFLHCVAIISLGEEVHFLAPIYEHDSVVGPISTFLWKFGPAEVVDIGSNFYSLLTGFILGYELHNDLTDFLQHATK